MAEEQTEYLSVPEDITSSLKTIAMGKPSSYDPERATGSSNNKDCSRRNSTGKFVSSPKITPNYMRASTGSCHDFCKYGKKHGSELEDNCPWRKKPTSTSSDKKSCVVKILSLPEKKISIVAKRTVSPVINPKLTKLEADSDAVTSTKTLEIIKREITVPKKKLEVSLKQDPSSEKRTKQSSSVIRPSSSYNSSESDQKTKKSVTRLSYSPQQVKARRSSSELQPGKARLSSTKQMEGTIKETIKNSMPKPNSPYVGKISKVNAKLSSSSRSAMTVDEEIKKSDSIKNRNKMAAFSSSTNKKLAFDTPLINKTGSIKPKKVGNLKPVSSVKEENRMLMTDVGKTGEDENVPEKTLHVVEVQTNDNLSDSIVGVDITPPLSPALSLPSFSPHEEVGILDVNPHPHESYISPVLSLCHIDTSLSDHEEEVVVKGHMEDDVEPEAAEVEEKQEEEQYREFAGGEIEEEMETEEDSNDDDDDDDDDNMYESDGVEEDDLINGTETINLNDVEMIHNKPLKKGYTLSDSGVPMKLKFKRGKVLDIQSVVNTGPKRLRFRQRRTIEENHNTTKNDNVSKRNFNKRDEDSKGNNNNKTNNNNEEEEKIVLRHQDSQGKKDAQGLLLNNVIEETASKLVETRKSKVKALVGAFETVISLQDSKPSVQLVV